VRIPDRDDELPDAEVLGVAEHGRREVAPLRAQDGEVGERVRADHLDPHLAPVDERRANAGGPARHDVRRCEHEAVGGDHDAASTAVHPPAPAHAARDAKVGDGGREELGDLDDGLRVGVEDVLLRRNFGRSNKRKIHHRSKLAAVRRSTEWARSRRSATEA
jgi:hypothetical protein